MDLSQTKIVIGTPESILETLKKVRYHGKSEHVSLQIDDQSNTFKPEIKRNPKITFCYRTAKKETTIIISLKTGTTYLLKPMRLKNIYNSIRGFDPEYTHISCGNFEDIIKQLTDFIKKNPKKY